MRRKSRPPPTVHQLAVPMPCRQCGAEFRKPPDWFERNFGFQCKSCGSYTTFTQDEFRQAHSANVADILARHEKLRRSS